MIGPKKLLKLTRKWQKIAAIRRKQIALPQTIRNTYTSSCSTSPMAEKGHFVVYSDDQKRFLLPLEYLNNEIIRQLFDMAEEEFGLPTTGHITLPCDAEVMEYAIALIKQNVNTDVQRALLMSIASSFCSSFFYLQNKETVHQLPICSF
ncbi:hypothetical protein JCGZ_18751 [Jatropha curcas]|uniref:Uncharacterized protein n=1 Tax=Jatropha curcas TaxID=180498 RepID=A0A067KDP8_JATCU|nr:auxin-responsive protein SAUR68 [Jatropha curcas]KDP29984.1 hypothetical protein JCGZ_18751 [Jatropha curcas]